MWFGRPGGDLLSRALRHSTMGAGGFHGRVRDGIGCGPPAKATRSSNPPWRLCQGVSWFWVCCVLLSAEEVLLFGCLWMISMHGVLIEPIGRLGPVSFVRYRISTPGLSTWWSTTALRETWFRGKFPA